jgi:hypothetical protein
MSESIMEYVQKKAFENIIVNKLLEKMDELYLMRSEIAGCLKEVDNAIEDIEKDIVKVMKKSGD